MNDQNKSARHKTEVISAKELKAKGSFKDCIMHILAINNKLIADHLEEDLTRYFATRVTELGLNEAEVNAFIEREINQNKMVKLITNAVKNLRDPSLITIEEEDIVAITDAVDDLPKVPKKNK